MAEVRTPWRMDAPYEQAGDVRDQLLGQVIDGRYRIIRVLGRGGMGVVYEAEQVTVERRVALKMMSAELSEEPDVVARFIREAGHLCNLSHPVEYNTALAAFLNRPLQPVPDAIND